MRHRYLQTAGKIGYGLLFVVIVPALIMLWGRRLDHVLSFIPAVRMPSLGWSLVGAGFLLVSAGWRALITEGKGLPMNAFPPERLVRGGMYSAIPHPIYTGFVIMTGGYFIMVGSGAGLWFVTPCVALASVTLVLGYERHDMERRFGKFDRDLLIHLPAASDLAPSASDRAAAFVLAFFPWLVLYEAAVIFGPAPDAVESYFSFEHAFPVIEGTELVYGLTYIYVIAAPLLCRRKGDLRSFIVMGQWATATGVLLFILLPLKATPRPFEPATVLGEMLAWERSMDGAAAAFPSFHVIWALLAARLFSQLFGLKPVWYLSALAIAISCITTGMHSLADIAGGFLVYGWVVNRKRLWRLILTWTERIANSWNEWQVGKVRIIVHGVYPAAGVLLGVIAASHLAGSRHVPFVMLISICSLIGAGLWGQTVEGSSKLSRPFGYYGGVFGGIAGIILSAALGADGWLLAGSFSVAAPFIQAIGRLRCLVQGCCHGRECELGKGIRFTHPRSRVLAIANLGHRPVYPTQLYSILYNLVLGALLIRAWTLAAPMPFITGVYLLLGGVGRFVEEAYRGEPQTPVYAGLALYQWLAVIGAVTGAAVTTLPGEACPSAVEILPRAFVYAVIFSMVTAFAMGVDFPESKKRFSLLTPDRHSP